MTNLERYGKLIQNVNERRVCWKTRIVRNRLDRGILPKMEVSALSLRNRRGKAICGGIGRIGISLPSKALWWIQEVYGSLVRYNTTETLTSVNQNTKFSFLLSNPTEDDLMPSFNPDWIYQQVVLPRSLQLLKRLGQTAYEIRDRSCNE